MGRDEGWNGGRLVEMTTEECWELLVSRPVGRVAYADADGPVVLPVNHSVTDQVIRFRTSPLSELARHVDGQRVGFQVDGTDDSHESGWSVLVRGRAALADVDLHERGGGRPTSWVGGNRLLVVEIKPDQVTGRRLLAT